MQFWRPIFKTFLLQRRPSFLLPWIIANTFQSGTNLVETIYLLGLNTVSQSPIQKFDNPFHLFLYSPCIWGLVKAHLKPTFLLFEKLVFSLRILPNFVHLPIDNEWDTFTLVTLAKKRSQKSLASWQKRPYGLSPIGLNHHFHYK